MHDLIVLKGTWTHTKNSSRYVPNTHIPKGGSVNVNHLTKLLNDLRSVQRYWKNEKLIDGVLIQVYYRGVVAKSNRITKILNGVTSDSIRGASFQSIGGTTRHVITYLLSKNDISEAIKNLVYCLKKLTKKFKGTITSEDFEKYSTIRSLPPDESKFLAIVKDAYYVSRFGVQASLDDVKGTQLVSFYRTDGALKDILFGLNLDLPDGRFLDDVTVSLFEDELAKIKNSAPYLISMAVENSIHLDSGDKYSNLANQVVTIPDPTDEPWVGVIDTLFDENSYFAKWVDSKVMLDPNLEIVPRDYRHGTEVCSIIVDGCSVNKDLEDGCGRFRVKHFGVAKSKTPTDRLTLLKKIRHIIKENPGIKVWNLSLGSELPCPEFSMSPDGAELDKIQKEFDVLFVVAGTNKTSRTVGDLRIGVPADSLNSVVVNSVKRNNQRASYSRHGPVLGFFYKPDVSCFGGDIGDYLSVCCHTGQELEMGTSFAAPWITRKLAFLIEKMKLSREVAKALLIDSARGWYPPTEPFYIGHGVVPRHINDILQTKNDEIRFILTGQTLNYETYNFELPIPFDESGQPFFARATMCYFPNCSREQGVDYTATELDLHFGRLKEGDQGKVTIHSIDANYQGDLGSIAISEEIAREYFRKWDNVKVVSDVISARSRTRKLLTPKGLWGISIKSKERSSSKNRQKMQFGVVVTLKEMKGRDRFDEFVKRCKLNGWFVQTVNIEQMLHIQEKSNELLNIVDNLSAKEETDG